MSFKPHNFFIGLIDFFAILLPGAILAGLLYILTGGGTEVIKAIPSYKEYAGFIGPFIFLLSAYLLGHVIMWLGSYLDQFLYDNLKSRIYPIQKHLALVKLIRKERYASNSVAYLNNFEWSRSHLMDAFPSAYEEVERYMAESKFFRALVIVLPLCAVWTGMQLWGGWAVGVGALWLFAIVRYFQRKQKATKTAYKHLIFLEEKKAELPVHPRKTPDLRKRDAQPIEKVFTETVAGDLQAYLAQDTQRTVKAVSIESGSQRTFLPLEKTEYLYCQQGKGMIYLQHEEETEVQEVWVSQHALIELPTGRQTRLENKRSEPFRLVRISDIH